MRMHISRKINLQSSRIAVDGIQPGAKDASLPRRRARMVFQGFGLFPHMTAIANIRLAQKTVLGRGGEGPSPGRRI